MRLVVVSDIFGKTDAFVELAAEIGRGYQVVELLDPYGGSDHNFADEKKAYDYFQKHVGLKEYSKKLSELLATKTKTACHLVGFSVGASALWLNSDKPLFHSETKIVGLYSSQIRNYLEIKPQVEVELYFPRYEEHFDIEEVIGKLEGYRGVRCFLTNYLHGFMNKKSPNYNKSGYMKYLEILQTL